MCANTSFLEACKLCHKDNQRLDHFWTGVIADHKCSDRFWSFFKKVLILSQGNAFIEQSFSLNKEVIVENKRNGFLDAQRQVYDGIRAMGGLDDLADIPKNMILKVRNSKELYGETLKKQRTEKESKALEDVKKKRFTEEVEDLKTQKLKLIQEKERGVEEINKRLEKLCVYPAF